MGDSSLTYLDDKNVMCPRCKSTHRHGMINDSAAPRFGGLRAVARRSWRSLEK